MKDSIEFIDEILSRLSQLSDATGLTKSCLIVEMAQMLVTLQTGLKEDKSTHEKETETLRKRIEVLKEQIKEKEGIKDGNE